MSVVDGGLQPAAGSIIILLDAVSVMVETGEIVLCFGVALLRCLFKPVCGTRGIFFDALAIVIHDAKIGLCLGVVVYGGLLVEA